MSTDLHNAGAHTDRTGFSRTDDQLNCDGVSLEQIALQFGTPTFVYSRALIEARYRSFSTGLAGTRHQICYAVKANANLAVLNVLARLGSGFDIVSGGELERVLAAGGLPGRVVFSGVGKRAQEMQRALEVGVRCFNVECKEELDLLETVAGALQLEAPVSIRVNPDVNPNTHPYISTGLRENKFGVALEETLALYERIASSRWLRAVGVDCHIGSQITEMAPVLEAFDRILELVDTLATRGIVLEHVDMGGGLGIRYRQEHPPSPETYARALCARLASRPLELLLEPGRSVVGSAGVLLTRVLYNKRNGSRCFAIVDAGMNDLIRPALYDGWHDIQAVTSLDAAEPVDIVGPVCESADFLGLQRCVPHQADTLLAVMECGAYGFVMSSNYNARPRAAEVMVDSGQAHLVRVRESVASLWAGERLLDA